MDSGFAADRVSGNRLQNGGAVDDIEVDPPLDSSDPLAFPVCILFEGAPTGMNISMTPITSEVPEPASLAALLLGGAGLLALRRR